MSSRIFIDRCPMSGVTTWMDYDDATDEFRYVTEQDEKPHIELAQALAKDDDYTKQGMKDDFWHYAHLPNVVIEQMRRRGVHAFNPHHRKKVLELIQTEYPYCKTTFKVHLQRVE